MAASALHPAADHPDRSPADRAREGRLAVVAYGVAAGVMVLLDAPAAVVLAVALAAIAATTDARTGRLPNGVVLLAGIPLLAAALAPPDTAELGALAVGAAVAAVPLLVLHLGDPASLGFGDVKLAVVLGAALGRLDPRLGLVALCVAAGVSLLWALASRRSSVALGPALVTGTLVASATSVALGASWS